jgi:GMP synthase-like glutamine amidotransferase
MTKPTIGLFEAGSYDPDFIGAHGAPSDWFKRFLGRVSDDGLEYRVYRAYDGDIPATVDECDGYLITGSPASAMERAPWMLNLGEFCIRAMETRPVVGICFGHQLLCQALGGEVRAAEVGWGIGVHSYAVTGTADWMDPPMPDVAMLTSHMDQVTTLPPGAAVLAESAFCPHAILQLGPNAITIQAHPEATRGCFGSVYEMRRERYAPGQADRALKSLEQPTDDDRVGHWLVKFFTDRISRADT